MFARILLIPFCLTLALLTLGTVNAEEPQSGTKTLTIGEMANAAADLRRAAEAFERFGKSLDGITGTIAESLATMSSGFDPFGYKTAFQTLGQQSEVIQRQNKAIRELLEREIERLRIENRELKRRQARKRRRRASGA